uniref:Folate-Biopterin Transporter (FBT) Family n=1 Tax=Peronospora matthiolae TaxID=2874970 RepID=A0AAV1TJS1_9STRA
MLDMDMKAVEEGRPSRLSSAKHQQRRSLYSNWASPGKPTTTSELENGALREGGPLNLLTRKSIGLLAQYAGVGFLTGVIPGVIYPVLQGYLNAEGTTIVSANVLVKLPWCFKMFFGVISDCFPVMGYRRRPYMVIGWVFCVAVLLVMAATDVPDPYYGDAAMHFINEDKWTLDQIASINAHAPNSAAKYVVPMMLASFGYLLCEVAADAMVVEHAQREPIEQRGRVQTAVYTVKTLFTAVGTAVIAFCMNGEEYAGSFSFALSFQQSMMITGIVCAPLVLVSWFLIEEERVVENVPFRKYMLSFWTSLQQRAIYQIVAYKFLSGVFNCINIVSASNIKLYWVHVTPFNNSLMLIAGTMLYAMTLAITGKYGLNWNWRTIIIITMCSAVFLDAVMTMLTIWDVVRNQWFWLGIPVIEDLPDGIRFMIASYVVVELAEVGHEGALYGLFTATTNLTTPFGRSLAKVVNAQFHVWLKDIRADTYIVRRDVTITVWIRYSMKLLSLAFLPLLPRQKAETQELKRTGGSSRLMGIITVGYLSFALVWATSVNLLSMYESTMCSKVTGGCGPAS